jgi:hypothetical protein
VKNKKWLLFLIIVLPSSLWLILETSSINSYRLNYFGPKISTTPKDTTFYSLDPSFKKYSGKNESLVDFKMEKEKYPFYIIMFVKEKYQKEGYRIAGLSEYLLYKAKVVEHFSFFLVCEQDKGKPKVQEELKNIPNPNLHFLALKKNEFDSLNFLFFKEKPYYVDYSFLVMVDNNRNIRGYYDGRYASEIKRLSDEYKHLRLRVEKEKMLEKNEIKPHEK